MDFWDNLVISAFCIDWAVLFRGFKILAGSGIKVRDEQTTLLAIRECLKSK